MAHRTVKEKDESGGIEVTLNSVVSRKLIGIRDIKAVVPDYEGEALVWDRETPTLVFDKDTPEALMSLIENEDSLQITK